MLIDKKKLKQNCKWASQKDPADMSDLELADEAYALFQALNDYTKCMNHGDAAFEPETFIRSKTMDIIYLLPDAEKSQEVGEYLKKANDLYPQFMKHDHLDEWSLLMKNIRNAFADLYSEVSAK